MASTRRLAAILAADVAGYSQLMGEDEEGTHERLQAHLRELVNPKIAEHHGRIVKNTGDGLLAEFPSVVDAVRCAAEMQRAMADRNAETIEDKRITFRVGINLGDVIAEPDDIYGDGVNVGAAGGTVGAWRDLHLPSGARSDPRQATLSVRGQGRAERQEYRSVCARLRVAPVSEWRTARDKCIHPGAAAATYRPFDNCNGRGEGARDCRHCLVGL